MEHVQRNKMSVKFLWVTYWIMFTCTVSWVYYTCICIISKFQLWNYTCYNSSNINFALILDIVEILDIYSLKKGMLLGSLWSLQCFRSDTLKVMQLPLTPRRSLRWCRRCLKPCSIARHFGKTYKFLRVA